MYDYHLDIKIWPVRMTDCFQDLDNGEGLHERDEVREPGTLHAVNLKFKVAGLSCISLFDLLAARILSSHLLRNLFHIATPHSMRHRLSTGAHTVQSPAT